MQIKGFIWLEEIVQKLVRKHAIATHEVVELFGKSQRIQFVEKGHRKDENVYAALGQTEEGRYLICFFIRKSDARALVLSAREMTKAERRLYGKK